MTEQEVRRPSKKTGDVVRDFIKNLSEDDARFVQTRLVQRLGGDVGEVVEFMQRFPEMDEFLRGANSADEMYARLDHIEAIVQGESKKRSR